MVEIASSVEPLKVSITNGINSTPTEWQTDKREVRLRLVPTWRAWPRVHGSRLPKHLLLKGGDDIYIQSGGTSMTPLGEKNISWPGEGVGRQAGSLLQRSQGC